MRWTWPLAPTVAIVAVAAMAQTPPLSPSPPPGAARPTPRADDVWQRHEQIRAPIIARLEAGTADPAADAAAAAARGEFGLILSGDGARGGNRSLGVTCFTPYRQVPRILTRFGHSDAITAEVMQGLVYAEAYNRALVGRPDYPDADLCREASPQDTNLDRIGWDIGAPARPALGPVRDLHEAARHGSAADVRRYLRAEAVDAFDVFGMTPLAWAVARDNRAAAEALLAAGASPWAGGGEAGFDALFWAAAAGRRAWFARLAPAPDRPFTSWSPIHLLAALAGGDRTIVAAMLAEPHERLRIEMVHPLPSAERFEPFLRDSPDLANELLSRAVAYDVRVDLVRLALRHGANPDATLPGREDSETALVIVAKGHYPGSVEIVDMLLRAGADPNRTTHRYPRPLWAAVGSLHLGLDITELDGRATANFRRLLAAGADINLPNDEGRPPIWVLLFPRRYAHRELDPSFVTPQLLEMLVRSGLNLNARWEGERVLALVEVQAGPNSELATTLRRLGARR